MFYHETPMLLSPPDDICPQERLEAEMPARDPELFRRIREQGLAQHGIAPTVFRVGAGSKRIAIYTRFSSDGQKISSTERQIRTCTFHAHVLGETKFAIFSDEGETGTNIHRPALQRLLSRLDEFDIIIVEDFDRWSREIYDAIPLAQTLEDRGIEFHCSLHKRALSKEDIIRAATQSEGDRRRRTGLLSAGLDQLVLRGGLPWGRNYGLKKTFTRGFPEIDDNTACIVREIFERLAGGAQTMDVVKTLNERGIQPPKKRKKWNDTTIYSILRNPIYTGLIQYRKTKITFCSTSRKSTTVRQSEEYLVESQNDRYRIVSDEIFVRANELHPYKPRAKATKKKEPAAKLINSISCDCGGARGQQMTWTRASGQLLCSARMHSGQCSKPIASIQNLERIVLQAARDRLFCGPEPESYAFTCLARLQELAGEHEQLRSELSAELTELNAMADRAVRQQLVEGWKGERVVAMRQAIEDDIKSVQARLDAIPRLSPASLSLADAKSFKDALDGLEQRLPFRPKHQSDFLLLDAFQRLVPHVQICRESHLEGAATIRIELSGQALFTDDGSLGFEPNVIVEQPFIFGGSTRWNPAKRQQMEELAQAGTYALTDEQWSRVKSHLPDTGKTHLGLRSTQTRTVADACLFRMRTGGALLSSPTYFGEPQKIANAMLRFTYSGGLDMMIEILGNDDPAWLEGLSTELFANYRRVHNSSIKPRIFAEQRELKAGLLIKRPDGRLTDEQWNAVAPALTRTALKPTGRGYNVIDTRTVLDAILTKLRTGCGWKRLPAELGETERLYLDICRIIYSGTWDAAVEIWAKAHPEVTRGLDMSETTRFKRSSEETRADAAPTYPDDVWRPVYWTIALSESNWTPLTDKEWLFISSVIENASQRFSDRRRGDWGRGSIDAILFRLSTQSSWTGLPSKFGPGEGVRKRFFRLTELGIWQELVQALLAKMPKTLVRYGYRIGPRLPQPGKPRGAKIGSSKRDRR